MLRVDVGSACVDIRQSPSLTYLFNIFVSYAVWEVIAVLAVQLSVDCLWAWIGMTDKQSSQTDLEPDSSEQAPANTSNLSSFSETTPARSSLRYGLDLHSCLQLLIDVYGSTLLPSSSSPPVPITLFNETVRSVSYCSDIGWLSFLLKLQF